MHRRLSIALSLSALLIGGATMFRFASAKDIAPALIAVDTPASDVVIVDSPIGTALPSPTESAPTEKLSTTDLVGRQLISEYIDLAAAGKATDDSITALATKYVANINTLNHPVVAGIGDIHAVSDTLANFQSYADGLKKIREEWVSQVKQLRTPATEPYASSKVLGTTYIDTADKLKKLPVPAAIASLHLELINNYLASGSAMAAASEAQSDPASAFAAVIALKDSLDNEDGILTELAAALTSHGL